MDNFKNDAELLKKLALNDIDFLMEAEKSYGASWMSRGGVGAFMVTIRKVDRIENSVKKHGYDIFKAIETDPSPTGILDDIRDYRRYLFLIEQYMIMKLGNQIMVEAKDYRNPFRMTSGDGVVTESPRTSTEVGAQA